MCHKNFAKAAAALLLAISLPAAADTLENYQADLSRYFPDAAQEQAARTELRDRTRSFTTAVSWQPRDATRHLSEGAGLMSSWMRHASYCRARYARDTGDHDAKSCETEADAQYEAVQSFVNAQLGGAAFARLEDADLARLGLTSYRGLIVRAGEAAGHSLSPEGVAAAAALADPLLNGLYDRYDRTVRGLTAPSLASAQGPLDPVKDAARIARDPDPAVRRDGATALSAAYEAHKEVLGAALIDVVREETALAKLHHYSSAPDWIYRQRLGVGEADVRALLDRISAEGGVLKDYQAVRARRVAAATGLAQVHGWDMALSSAFTPAPLDIEAARGVILGALAPLGPDYVSRFAWLLDPANRAIDLAGGGTRYRGGFSLGFSGGVPVMLYVGGFDGSFAKISTIIHEGGHAVHRVYMSDVPPYDAEAPKFIAEAIAIFNELLLLDARERDSTSPAERVFYQEKFLDKLAHELFASAEEGALELGLYGGVASGRIVEAGAIDALNGDILGHYELFAGEPGMRGNWMKKGLLYEDPLYLVNYLYAALVACRFYTAMEADPEGFRVRYAALLHQGYDASGDAVLRRTMGFGLEAGPLLEGALTLMKERTGRLDASYRTLPR